MPKVMDAPQPAPTKDEPKNWKRVDHPTYRKEKKWDGKYDTPKDPQQIGDQASLAKWIHDMTDWGLMMHDEVIELTKRVRVLEDQVLPKERRQ
jgi:hypothetical protein